MANQALGLAEAVSRLTPAEIVVKHLRWRDGAGGLPNPLRLAAPRALLHADSDRIDPPWPDLWIATGRATLPFSIRLRGWSGGQTFVVQTQDPRWPTGLFDMVVAPVHDQLSGDGVFEITGAPNRVTPQRLAEAAVEFQPMLEKLPRPRVAVLIGGRSKAFDLSEGHALGLGRQIAAAVSDIGGSVMATVSRRTPPGARDALAQGLEGVPGWVWDGKGANPLFAFLQAADHILVTEDSANMAVEAAATGKPVSILPMIRRGPADKFDRLHEDLRARGATRPFQGALNAWSYEPLAETDRAAHAVLEAMAAQR